MVTCGGQATIPIVAAVNSVAPVAYGEIVASIASKSAGPGTRANIDEFTETTSLAIEQVGGAQKGKAIIILNPAEPPMLMRDTVYCLVSDGDTMDIASAVEAKVEEVRKYVSWVPSETGRPIRALDREQPPRREGDQLERIGPQGERVPRSGGRRALLAGLRRESDIMTSAALITGERIAALEHEGQH